MTTSGRTFSKTLSNADDESASGSTPSPNRPSDFLSVMSTRARSRLKKLLSRMIFDRLKKLQSRQRLVQNQRLGSRGAMWFPTLHANGIQILPALTAVSGTLCHILCFGRFPSHKSSMLKPLFARHSMTALAYSPGPEKPPAIRLRLTNNSFPLLSLELVLLFTGGFIYETGHVFDKYCG